MKKTLLFAIAVMSLLSACAPEKPMDEETRQRMIRDMQASEVYH